MSQRGNYRGENQRGGRGGYNNRGGRGGRGGYRGGFRAPHKYMDLTITKDQVFDMVDGGCNLTNEAKFGHCMENVIKRAMDGGVSRMVVTGLKFNGAHKACAMSATRDQCYAAIGVHPHFVSTDWKPSTYQQLLNLAQKDGNKIAAVGEVGLDFAKDYSPRDLQTKAFSEQVRLAKEIRKPLMVHERDSFDEVMEVLENHEPLEMPVVMHCFTGTEDQIKACVAKGFYIGVTGFVCKDKHGAHLRQAIANEALPLDNIIVQSNAPFMVPNVPQSELDPVSEMLLQHCTEDNEPCSLSVVVRCIAKQKQMEPRTVAAILKDNAMSFFSMDE